MPTLKFERVVSCNSEDIHFPASNLLESESYKKWKCKTPGEEHAVVILQLEGSTHITGIDIGNEGSAFVEVLVGRQCSDDFKVLLVSSSFMSPQESKNGTLKNRVRMFSKEQLCKPVVDEKWDRVKVVCRQPFNRYQQYGLCFITLHSPEVKKDDPSSVPKLGRFVMKEDDDTESLAAGCLFARRKEKPPDEEPLKGAAAIRAASRPEALMQKTEPKRNKVLEQLKMSTSSQVKVTDKPKTPDSPQDKPKANTTPKFPVSANSTHATDKPKTFTPKTANNNVRNGTSSVKRPSTESSSVKPKKLKENEEKKVPRKPFHKLLEGVVFVISGYQNPDRSNVRGMALDMGAKYKPDWDPTCTHLICAFMNTPKFQQVRGKGCIVRKEWVEQCHTRRARLPWRRHALDKRDQSKPESEDEILEEVQRLPTPSPATATAVSGSDSEQDSPTAGGTDYGSDTEEEIERVRAAANPAVNASDTEEEEPSVRPDTSSLPWPHLPDIFAGCSFYLRPKLSPHLTFQNNRYIIANGGSIMLSDAPKVDYIVAENQSGDIEERKRWPTAAVVDSSWIVRCVNSSKLQPTSLENSDSEK